MTRFRFLLLSNVLIALFPLFFSSCIHQKFQKNTTHEKNITAIDFYSILSVIDSSGKTFNVIDDKEGIYFYNDLVMYQVPVYSSIISVSVNDEPPKQGLDSVLPVSYRYVVFKEKEDSIAFSYKSLSGPVMDTFSVNSFLSNGFRNFGKIFKQTSISEILLSSERKGDSIMEKYIPRIKENDSFSDTTYYYYRKDYNNVKFSLAPELDSLREMKMYKMFAVFNGNPQSNDLTYRLPRQLKLEIEKKKVTDPGMIISLFKQFEKDLLSYKAGI